MMMMMMMNVDVVIIAPDGLLHTLWKRLGQPALVLRNLNKNAFL